MKWKVGDKFIVRLKGKASAHGDYYEGDLGEVVGIFNKDAVYANLKPTSKSNKGREDYVVSLTEMSGISKLEKALL